jgi:hypothetical protein
MLLYTVELGFYITLDMHILFALSNSKGMMLHFLKYMFVLATQLLDYTLKLT